MRKDSSFDKHYLWELKRKKECTIQGVGWGALPYNPEKQSVHVHTAANAHLYMLAGPMFHSLAH